MKTLIFCSLLLILSEPADAQLGDSKVNDEFVGDLAQLSTLPMISAGGVAGIGAIATHQELNEKKSKLEALKLKSTKEQLNSSVQLAQTAEAEFVRNEIKPLEKQLDKLKKQTYVLKQMLDTSNEEVRISEKNLLAAKKFYENIHHVSVETLTDEQKNADHKLRVHGEDEKIAKTQHEKVLLLIQKNLTEQENISKQLAEAKLAATNKWRSSSAGTASKTSELEATKELEKLLKLEEEVVNISKVRLGYGASGVFLVLSASGILYEGALLKSGHYVDSRQFEAKAVPNSTVAPETALVKADSAQ